MASTVITRPEHQPNTGCQFARIPDVTTPGQMAIMLLWPDLDGPHPVSHDSFVQIGRAIDEYLAGDPEATVTILAEAAGNNDVVFIQIGQIGANRIRLAPVIFLGGDEVVLRRDSVATRCSCTGSHPEFTTLWERAQ